MRMRQPLFLSHPGGLHVLLAPASPVGRDNAAPRDLELAYLRRAATTRRKDAHMRKVELTKGKVALVDDADYELVRDHKWYFHGVYAATRVPRGWGLRKSNILMHWFVLYGFGEPPAGIEVHHINGNTLDNRRMNLEETTHRQHLIGGARERYRGRNPARTTRYVGVIHRGNGRFTADVKHMGVTRTVRGTFASAEAAAVARAKLARRLRGEPTPRHDDDWQSEAWLEDLRQSLSGLGVPLGRAITILLDALDYQIITERTERPEFVDEVHKELLALGREWPAAAHAVCARTFVQLRQLVAARPPRSGRGPRVR